MQRRRNTFSGVTLIEALVVVTVMATLAALATPSFGDLLASKRVSGAAAQLVAELQNARSESVLRNTKVRVTFSNGGYALSKDENEDGTWEDIREIQLSNGMSFSSGSGVTFTYDPKRGTATVSSPNGVTLSKMTSRATHALQITVNVMGRAQCTKVSGDARC